jgi:hypothetical protein
MAIPGKPPAPRVDEAVQELPTGPEISVQVLAAVL